MNHAVTPLPEAMAEALSTVHHPGGHSLVSPRNAFGRDGVPRLRYTAPHAA